MFPVLLYGLYHHHHHHVILLEVITGLHNTPIAPYGPYGSMSEREDSAIGWLERVEPAGIGLSVCVYVCTEREKYNI